MLKEGTHAVSDMRELLFVPFLKWFLLCILFSSWIFTAICLVASGDYKQHTLPNPVMQGFPLSFSFQECALTFNNCKNLAFQTPII